MDLGPRFHFPYLLSTRCFYHCYCILPCFYDGNDSPCKIEGNISVFIWIFDGFFLILSNIRYASKLRRNLISLNTLDAHRYKFISEGGLITVCEGALDVFLKGTKDPL